MLRDRFMGSLIGSFVGDALGLPYEYATKEEMDESKCIDMVGNKGIHRQPKGTWSDESSMIYATIDALIKAGEYNPVSIMDNYLSWLNEGKYTPYNHAFDTGVNVLFSLNKYAEMKASHNTEFAALNSNFSDNDSNDNGSLMRMLPISLYSLSMSKQNAFILSMNFSSLTHAHSISRHCCAFFTLLIHNLNSMSIEAAYTQTKLDHIEISNNLKLIIPKKVDYILHRRDIKTLKEEDLNSKNDVLNTLEIALWSILNFRTYREGVLAIINKGYDTDTNASVFGSLFGFVYGLEAIPEEWIFSLARKDVLFSLAESFYNFCIKM